MTELMPATPRRRRAAKTTSKRATSGGQGRKRAGRRAAQGGPGITVKQTARRAGRPPGTRDDKLRFVLDWLALDNNLDRLYNLFRR